MKSSRLRSTRIVLELSFAMLVCMCIPAHARMIEGIVAVVDDQVIMMSDLQSRTEVMGLDSMDAQTLSGVLKMMVEDIIVEMSYKSMGFSPVSSEKVLGIASQSGLAPEDARMMIMKRTLMDMMVSSRVVVTDKMIRESYEKNETYCGRDSVFIKQILIRDDKKKVDSAIESLDEGLDFDEVATEYSDVLVSGSSSLGWVALEDLSPVLASALDDARVGSIVGPIVSNENIFIFDVVDRGVNGGTPLEEVRDDITRNLEETGRQEAFEHWLGTMMDEHFVGIYLTGLY